MHASEMFWRKCFRIHICTAYYYPLLFNDTFLFSGFYASFKNCYFNLAFKSKKMKFFLGGECFTFKCLKIPAAIFILRWTSFASSSVMLNVSNSLVLKYFRSFKHHPSNFLILLLAKFFYYF